MEHLGEKFDFVITHFNYSINSVGEPKVLRKKIAKLMLPTLMMLGMIVILQVSVQSRPRPIPIDKGSIQVPCCHCVGDDGAMVNINTGTTPFNVTGPGVSNPIAVPIAINLNSSWTASLPSAGWVQPNNNNGATTYPVGLYKYSVKIKVPNCTIPMQAVLAGSAAGDDAIVVKIDGVPKGSTPLVPVPSFNVPAGALGWGFTSERIVNFTPTNLTPGTHTLTIEVTNGVNSPHGVIVQANVRTICSKNLVKPTKEEDGEGTSR
jgi:hypothetical protein